MGGFRVSIQIRCRPEPCVPVVRHTSTGGLKDEFRHAALAVGSLHFGCKIG